METTSVLMLSILIILLGLIVMIIGSLKDHEGLMSLGLIILLSPMVLCACKMQSLQIELNHYQQTPIEKNRIYEYEISGNDTIPVDTIYTEGMSGRTYYYK